MKKSRQNQLNTFVLLSVLTSLFTGCTAANWRPSSMFSWKKKTASSEFAQAEAPESPASKYTPGTIASVGAQSGGSSTTGAAAAAESAYGYTSPTSSATNPLGSGLAAKANGYQTGPYQVGGASPSSATPSYPSSTTPVSATTAANTVAATPNTMDLPNPYGGNYKGSTTTPDVKLPSSVENAIAEAKSNMQYPNATLPTTQNATNNAQNIGYPTGGSSAAAGLGLPSGMPTYPSTQAPSGMQAPPSSAYQPGGVSTGGGSPEMNLPDLPALPGVGGTTAPSSTTPIGQPSMSLPAATTPSTFTPGTTSRNTGYDFSSGSSSNSTSGMPANPLLR